MIFGMKRSNHREVNAQELAEMIESGGAMVIDVREPDEFAAGHIPGATNLPLSRFSPDQLPDPEGKLMVLACLGGKRSGMALDKCGLAGSSVDTHLAGGFGAWRAAHLPVER